LSIVAELLLLLLLLLRSELQLLRSEAWVRLGWSSKARSTSGSSCSSAGLVRDCRTSDGPHSRLYCIVILLTSCVSTSDAGTLCAQSSETNSRFEISLKQSSLQTHKKTQKNSLNINKRSVTKRPLVLQELFAGYLARDNITYMYVHSKRRRRRRRRSRNGLVPPSSSWYISRCSHVGSYPNHFFEAAPTNPTILCKFRKIQAQLHGLCTCWMQARS
jgi:hypothetical protein